MESMSSEEREHYRQILRNGGTLPPFGETRNGPPGTPTTKTGTNGQRTKAKSDKVGRFQVLNQFVDESAKEFNTTAVAVWLVLWRETKPDGLAKVSFNQIGERLGISRRSVMRSVSLLVEAKLVKVVSRGTATGHMPSTYRVFGRPQIE